MATSMKVSWNDFQRQVIPDSDADTSYLEQGEFKDRLAAYRRGDFGFVGVRAVAELHIPSNGGGVWNRQTIQSAGLWGIEDDSEPAYIDEVWREECAQLAEMLEQMGLTVTDAPVPA